MDIRENYNINIKDSPQRRLVTLDILRGIAIFGVTLVHISYKLYDSSKLFENIQNGIGMPFYVWILIVILGYFGTWHGFFLFISAIVNSYTFTRKAFNNIELKKIFLKNTIAGLIVVVLGYLVEGFGYFGYFGHAFRTGEWDSFGAFLGENSWIQTLQIIGLGLVINGIIQYFLYRNKGYEKIKRNLLIYCGLAILILLVTPLINYGIASLDIWSDVSGRNWPDIYFVSGNRSTAAWFLTIIAGPKSPLFPYLTSAFIGSMIGIFLGSPKPKMKWLTHFSLGGVGLFVIGGLLVVISIFTNFRIDPRIPFIDTGLPFSIIEEPPAIPTYMVRLGGQICLVMILLRIAEFRGKGDFYANKFILRYFRRWSSLSLTLYSLQILEILPRAFLKACFYDTEVTSINFMQDYSVDSIWWIVLIIAFILLFYEFVIFFFYKVNFVGSLEWSFVKLQNLVSKEKSTKINQALLKNEINWVSLKEDLDLKQIS
ncbi:MAG: hypothetical protein JXA54_08335 [Candidatus Heimdallarchaeota archaeon]|nr:hypothetical protein [Candidatus Heimdallarchaeota archaeon]